MTYVALAKTTLSSNASSITFSGFSSAYTDLVIRLQSRSTRTGGYGDLVVRFNNQTSGFIGCRFYSDGNTLGADGATHTNTTSSVSGTGTDVFGFHHIYIPQYNGSKNKTLNIFGNGVAVANAFGTTTIATAQWNSTSAITSIQMVDISNNDWQAGTVAWLYGVRNS